jgi:hypothetical protein
LALKRADGTTNLLTATDSNDGLTLKLGYTGLTNTTNWLSLYGTGTSGAGLQINSGQTDASGQIVFSNVAKTRWQIQRDPSVAETGSNVGSDLKISAYNDAGDTLLSTPLTISRATGITTLTGLSVTGTVNITGSNKLTFANFSDANLYRLASGTVGTDNAFQAKGGIIIDAGAGNANSTLTMTARSSNSALTSSIQVDQSGNVAWSLSAADRTYTLPSLVRLTNDTESTAANAGSVLLSGGMGVAKSVYVGGNIGLSGNMTITDGTSGHTFTIDRKLTSQNNYLRWSTDGAQNWVLGSGATGTNTDLELYSYGANGRVAKFDYATKGTTLEGALTVAGTSYLDGLHTSAFFGGSKRIVVGYDTTNDYGYIASVDTGVAWKQLRLNPDGGRVVIPGTENSTDKTSGALVIGDGTNGGLGVSGNIHAGGNIITSGLVKVGATGAPDSRLHVYEDTAAGVSNGLTIEQDGTGDAVAAFLLTGVQRWSVGVDNSDADKFKIGTGELGSADKVTLDTSGNLTATGNITAYYSDERLKTRLGKIENAVEKVKTLSGFYFAPNDTAMALGYQKKVDVGVSAQEVKAILPEVIAPAPIDPQYMTVRYEKLIPLLIEAIKEQQEQIETLKQMVAALTAK